MLLEDGRGAQAEIAIASEVTVIFKMTVTL